MGSEGRRPETGDRSKKGEKPNPGIETVTFTDFWNIFFRLLTSDLPTGRQASGPWTKFFY